MNQMNRTERDLLEIRVNDAADGLLNQQEISDLKRDLQNHPDLLQDYQQIMNLPDFSGVYGDLQRNQPSGRISVILKQIERIESHKHPMNFENITILWFKKYAIAASILILAITSVFNLNQPESVSGDLAIDELFYPESDLASDEYVTYLIEWIEP